MYWYLQPNTDNSHMICVWKNIVNYFKQTMENKKNFLKIYPINPSLTDFNTDDENKNSGTKKRLKHIF